MYTANIFYWGPNLGHQNSQIADAVRPPMSGDSEASIFRWVNLHGPMVGSQKHEQPLNLVKTTYKVVPQFVS